MRQRRVGCTLVSASSFESQYEAWLGDGSSRNETIERELVDTYRRAWTHGSEADREAVLHFILLRRERNGYDLVLEGLKDSSSAVTRIALSVAFSLLLDGSFARDALRATLTQLTPRLPESREKIADAIGLVDAD